MEPIYVVAFISFLLGVFGYIITHFWIHPILRYRKIKHRIASDLKWYLEVHENEIKDKIRQEQFIAKNEILRSHSAELKGCFSYDLPPWYKLLLESRRESPADASKHLLDLANIRNLENADHCMEQISKSLNLQI